MISLNNIPDLNRKELLEIRQQACDDYIACRDSYVLFICYQQEIEKEIENLEEKPSEKEMQSLLMLQKKYQDHIDEILDTRIYLNKIIRRIDACLNKSKKINWIKEGF